MQAITAPLPREHGAWALLYGPFALALVAGGVFHAGVVLLLVSVTSLFLAHEPLSKLARTRHRNVSREQSESWKKWLAIYAAVFILTASLLLVVFQKWLLIPLGIGIVLLLSLHLGLVSGRQERHIYGELVGVLGLTATAPAVYYVARGELEPGIRLWVLALLYFLSGLFYVRMRISRITRRKEAGSRFSQFLAYHLLLPAVLVAGTVGGWIQPLLAFAYIPALVRAFLGIRPSKGKPNIKRIGYMEVAHTILFLVVFSVVWHLG